MAFACNHAERRVQVLLESPPILRVASKGENRTAGDTRGIAVY
jgi:hypothetical protein